MSQHRDLGPRYLAEGTSQSAAVQLRAYSIGLVLGLAALGAVQAAATLFGPMTILFLGMSLVTIPEAARVLRRSPRHLPLFCLAVSSGLALLGLVWGVVLLVALPRGLGQLMLGNIWRPTYPLVLPTTLWVMGTGALSGALVGLHALAAARRSLRSTLFTSALGMASSLAAAVIAGMAGAMWASAAASWIGVLVAWVQLRRALHEPDATAGPPRLAPVGAAETGRTASSRS